MRMLSDFFRHVTFPFREINIVKYVWNIILWYEIIMRYYIYPYMKDFDIKARPEIIKS